MNLLTVLGLILGNGGVTYSVTRRTIKQTGFAVSPYKHCETKVKTLTVRHIAAFIAKHRDLLARPNHYLGAWEYDGHFYLDVSIVEPSQHRARQIAIEARQLAYYCLNQGREYKTEEPVEA